MPLDYDILKRVCVEDFEKLDSALYNALLEHREILLIANSGGEKMCSTVKALRNQPMFSTHKPRIMLILHNAAKIAELFTYKSLEDRKIGVATITADIHTNNIIKQLSTFPDLISGTPAKLIDIIEKGYVDIRTFDAVVVDDVSSFKDLGYFEQLEQILQMLGEHTKVILTSNLENQDDLPFILQTKPHIINHLRLSYPYKFHAFTIISDESEKPDTLFQLLCELQAYPTVVFCNDRGSVIRLEKFLLSKKIKAGIVHGGLLEHEREMLLAMFRNGSIHVLITTDRAIVESNIPDIEYIVHYHLPLNAQAYSKRNQVLLGQRPYGTAFHILQEDEDQPDFIHTLPDVIHLSDARPAPVASWWLTLKITIDGNDELNQADAIELLISKGNLHRDEIGLFERGQFGYYQAVSSKKAEKTIKKLDGIHFRKSILRVYVVDITYS
ncbi:MAG: DEAD/DEAH box helicase [Bacteroidales bacterium]|jgi:hypothetical protein|nr:DEAD/DEAH box helicase [Bacteroidales bacterium]